MKQKINDGSLSPSSTDSKSADKRSAKSDGSIKMESNHNLIQDLLNRADRVEKFRKSIIEKNTIKSPHEEAVESFVAYLRTQLRQVHCND